MLVFMLEIQKYINPFIEELEKNGYHHITSKLFKEDIKKYY